MTAHSPILVVVGAEAWGVSLALAMKHSGWKGTIRGVDRPEALEHARGLGALDEDTTDVATGCWGAELVVVAKPIGAALQVLPTVLRHAPAGAVITDLGATKRQIVALAREQLGAEEAFRFIGGHALLATDAEGKLTPDPQLFSGKTWLLTPAAPALETEAATAEGWKERSAGHALLFDLVERAGARVELIGASEHDRAMAWCRQLPQLLRLLLAAELNRQQDGGAGLRLTGLGEVERLATEPFSAWRDVLWSNADVLDGVLERMQQELDFLRTHLRAREVETLFHAAEHWNERFKTE